MEGGTYRQQRDTAMSMEHHLADAALEQSQTARQERAAAVGVDLNRNRSTQTGVPVSPDHRYRMIGEAGFEDFLSSGTVRARQGTKRAYEAPYFGPAPLDRYRQRDAAQDYVAEVHHSKVADSGNGYEIPHNTLGPGDVTIHRLDNVTGSASVVHSPTQFHPGLRAPR